MFSKLPPWVEIGCFSLTVIAGMVNVVGLIGFEHQAISHLTGISSFLGMELVRGRLGSSWHLVLIIISFFLGAVLSGLIVKDEHLRLGHRYSVALIVETLFLSFAALLLNMDLIVGQLFAAAACGLQNAMVSTYSGAVLRTTHVTGIFTDLGIMFGNLLCGKAIDRRKVKLYLILIVGFVLASILGTILFTQLQFNALYIPALSTFSLAIVYWRYLVKTQRK